MRRFPFETLIPFQFSTAALVFDLLYRKLEQFLRCFPHLGVFVSREGEAQVLGAQRIVLVIAVLLFHRLMCSRFSPGHQMNQDSYRFARNFCSLLPRAFRQPDALTAVRFNSVSRDL